MRTDPTGRWPRCAALRLARRARRPGLAGTRLPDPRPGEHDLRRVCRDPELPGAVDRADQGAHPRPDRQLRPGARGLPDGLPEMQTQHTCILLEDITEECNLRCPTCFADSAPGRPRWCPSPTCWPPSTTAGARERPDRRPHAQRRRADAPPLARGAAGRGGRPADRADPGQHQRPRGSRRTTSCSPCCTSTASGSRSICSTTASRPRRPPTTAARTPAVQGARGRALSGAGVFTTLTMTAALGVNDGEIGAVIQRAMDTPYVGGVTIQPVFGSGPRAGIDPTTGSPTRASLPGSGADRRRDHLAGPDRAALLPPALLLGRLLAARRRGQWRSLVALIGHDRLKEFLDLDPICSPTGSPTTPSPRAAGGVKESLLGLLSEQSSLSHPSMLFWRTSAPTATWASARCRPWRPRGCPGSTSGCAGCSASGSCGSPSSRSWTSTP